MGITVQTPFLITKYIFYISIPPQCEELFTGQEQAYLEEERNRILAHVDDLKQRVSDLEQQLQETKQEVDAVLTLTICLAGRCPLVCRP